MWLKSDYTSPILGGSTESLPALSAEFIDRQASPLISTNSVQVSIYRRLLFYKTRNTGTRFALKWNFLEKLFMFSEGTPPKGQWCNFSVNDQWPGLASQDLQNFFGIFTHTSFSNPRLDLAIQDLYKIILVIEQVMVLWHFLFSMSTCVKVLTLLTKLLVRKQLDVIIAHLPHLLHKIICVLIVFIEKIF